MDALAASRLIDERVRRLGFARWGVCEATPSDRPSELRAWIAAGKHGEMGYLADRVEERIDPNRALEGVRSVIVVADVYASVALAAPGSIGTTDVRDAKAGPRGKVARYARGHDYHKTLKKRLHMLSDDLRASVPAAGFRSFVDTAPVLEREHAARAGLGWVGKHTLLIHPRDGSYFFLGGVLTTLEVAPPESQRAVPDHCGTCTRCIDACPTNAITPHSVDATRCISYLTLEHRSAIDPGLHTGMGDWVAGCDVCQEVCPHNRPREADTPEPASPAHPDYTPARDGFDLLGVLSWSEEDRREAFRSSALKRIKLGMMKRNALVAIRNEIRRTPGAAWVPEAKARIAEIAGDAGEVSEDALVVETALAVLRGLGSDADAGS